MLRTISWAAALLLTVLLCAFLYVRQHQAVSRLDERTGQVTQLQQELRQNRTLIDSLVLLCQADTPASFDSAPLPVAASAQADARLRKKGFSAPQAQLLQHLQRQPGLVPAKGSLGGTIAFRELTLLTERYALGYFEDGHRAGYALLRFNADSPEQIRWQLLDYYQL